MKRECNIVRDLLPLYIENMVSAESREFIEEHLSKCPECNEIYNSMLETKEDEKLGLEEKEEQCEEILPLLIVKRKLNKKRIVTSIIAVVISLVILLVAGTVAYSVIDKHNKEAEIDYGESQRYSIEDRKAAVDDILNTIYAQGFGYDIISIRFAGDAACLEEWEQYGEDSIHALDIDDCSNFMVFYIDMKTPAWSKVWDSNTLYKNTKWAVARFKYTQCWQSIYINTAGE